jgi:hypothetical protein
MKTTLKTSVAAGALLALAAPVASGSAEAMDKTAFKAQNSKVNLTIGGQIVRSLIYADDGEHSQLFHVDGRTTGTRVRYIVSGQLTESIKVGGLIEHDVGQSNNSFTFANGTTTASVVSAGGTGATVGVATGNDSSSDTTSFGIRHHFVSFEHKSLGKLSLGQTNSASNGTMELGYAGSGNLTLAGGTMLSGIEFTTGTNGAFSGLAAASQTNTFDGLSRDDVIRYDTPKFGGFSLATSMQDEGTFDVALRYGGKIAGLSVKAAAHYANIEAGAGGEQFGISAAVKHSSGLSARAAYGGQSVNASGRTPRATIAGVGYSAKISSLGSTDFYFEWYNAEDIAAAGRDMDTYYFGVSQKLSSIGSEVGLVYGQHSLDDTASTDYNDINAVMFQTKLNF